MGAIAHAAEGIDCANLPNAIAWAHSDSDDAQASAVLDPGASDTAVPHRHADCHGHHIALPMAKADIAAPALLRAGYRTLVPHGNAAADRAADLRPPIA
jgi:hypothetical protein